MEFHFGDLWGQYQKPILNSLNIFSTVEKRSGVGLFKGDFLNQITGQINYIVLHLNQIKGQIKYLGSSLMFYQVKKYLVPNQSSSQMSGLFVPSKGLNQIFYFFIFFSKNYE